jgi:phosphinothricin acetyltransferase
VHLRFATTDDGAAMAAIYAPYVEGTAISFEAVPPTADEMRRRFEDTAPWYPWLVAVDDDEGLLGYAYGHRFAERDAYGWSVETSIYLHPDARGRGVGRALYRALLDLLAAQGYRQAFGGIALPNEASVALHESLGYARVATYTEVGFKLGTWHDVGWWQRALDVDGPSPRAPSSIDDLDRALVERVLGAVGQTRFALPNTSRTRPSKCSSGRVS